MDRKIRFAIDEIKDQYLMADHNSRPWIIGFSGGKDSTAMLTLVWMALKEIKNDGLRWHREIVVVSNDTMVENPIITAYVNAVLDKIEKAAIEQNVPIKVVKTTPRLEDSFWVNLIGRGYPTPNSAFRWCTERLKIKPTSRYITETLEEHQEAIILLGTRASESSARAKSVKKFAANGKRLAKHPKHLNVHTYAPIKHLMLEQVWYIVNAFPSPWGADNEELFSIYASANADDYECPTVVTDKSHKSCGQSRFGCWVCTVVTEDKSMSGLIENGQEWLRPLLDFRNKLQAERNDPKNRFDYRRDGSDALNGLGQLSDAYRAKLLKRLLKAQKDIQVHFPEMTLITYQELVAIQVIWHREFIFDFNVSMIYNRIYNAGMTMEEIQERTQREHDLLKDVCKDNPKHFDLIQELLVLQRSKALLNRKRGLRDDIEARIEKAVKPTINTVDANKTN
jgi:DNA sulfur modification protein DndC